jgi:hypothetical protein
MAEEGLGRETKKEGECEAHAAARELCALKQIQEINAFNQVSSWTDADQCHES